MCLTEKFPLNICMIDWTRIDILKELKANLISTAKSERQNLLEVEEEYRPFCEEGVERTIQIINHIIVKIDEFISEEDSEDDD